MPKQAANNGAGKHKIGLALAGGGPLGGVYEIGALIALNEALDGVDFQDVDVLVGVSAGALISALLANGISPQQMARVFIDPRPEDPRFSPLMFMQPAFGEYARRGLSVPWLLVKSTASYLRNPLRNGLLASFTQLTQAIPTAVFDNQPIERFLADLFSNRGCTDDFRKLKRQLYVVAVDLDTGQAVKFGDPPRTDADLEGGPGQYGAAGSVSAGRYRRTFLCRRRSQAHAARLGGAGCGRGSVVLHQSDRAL